MGWGKMHLEQVFEDFLGGIVTKEEKIREVLHCRGGSALRVFAAQVGL